MFTVAKTNAIGAINQYIHDAKDGSRAILNITTLGASNMSNAVTAFNVAGLDNLPHVYTEQWNTGTNSKLTISGIGDNTGDAGSTDWDYATLFSNPYGTEGFEGWIGEFIVFDRALDATEIALVQQYLEGKWLHVLAKDFNDDFSGDF